MIFNMIVGNMEVSPDVLVLYDHGTFGKDTNGNTFDASFKASGESNGNVIKNTSDMTWTCGHSTVCMFYISPKVKCTGFDTLNISFSGASLNLDESIKVGLVSDVDAEGRNFAAVMSVPQFSGSKDVSVDVSKVGDGEYYVALWLWADGDSSMNVNKIWLE